MAALGWFLVSTCFLLAGAKAPSFLSAKSEVSHRPVKQTAKLSPVDLEHSLPTETGSIPGLTMYVVARLE